MLLLNFLTASVCVVSSWVYRGRFRDLSAHVLESARVSESNSVQAASVALALADFVRDASAPADDAIEVYSPPRILGYGQTRSSNALYLYRDIEENGIVRREFIKRIPLH